MRNVHLSRHRLLAPRRRLARQSSAEAIYVPLSFVSMALVRIAMVLGLATTYPTN